jgi:hypothetical protein
MPPVGGRMGGNPHGKDAGGNAGGGNSPGQARAGLGGPQSRNGDNAAGMSKKLLDAKYPGASKKKNRQYELSAENAMKVGTIAAGIVGGPIGTAVNVGYSALSGDMSMEGMLDPFSGRMADVPSVGAGYAENNQKETTRMTPAELLAAKKTQLGKNKTKLAKGFTLLAGSGGTLLGS